MGTLNPTDAGFELQRWHPDLHISPELASWLLGCSGEDLLLAASGAVPIETLNKIMQHARHPERGPGDLQARVLHGLAIGAKKIPIRGSDHIPFGSREFVVVTRRESSMAVFEGPAENLPDLREQDQHLPIDWTGGKDHGYVSLTWAFEQIYREEQPRIDPAIIELMDSGEVSGVGSDEIYRGVRRGTALVREGGGWVLLVFCSKDGDCYGHKHVDVSDRFAAAWLTEFYGGANG